MKRYVYGVLVALVVVAVLMLPSAGLAATATEIWTADDLNNVRNNMGGSYILKADIDLSESVWSAVYGGAGWEPIGAPGTYFWGTFDGGGHTITGLYINRPDTENIGLFGYASSYSPMEIRNLTLSDVDVTGKRDVGALVGYNASATITNSHATGTVRGTLSNVGGLVGINTGGTVTNSSATGTVTVADYKYVLGGLVGQNWGNITNSYADVNAYGTYVNDIGGLVGWNNGGTISNSYAIGNVAGFAEIGGLVGANENGTVTNSYATGAVTGSIETGGLVGGNRIGGIVTNSYATGAVTGNGGLVGLNEGEPVTNSYYNSQTTSKSDTGKGVPMTSTEMVQQSTFSGWNFTADTGTWSIDEWESYPYLQWSSRTPAPPAVTGVTVSPSAVYLTYGDSAVTLTPTVSPAEAVQAVTWASSDTSVATVDENGVVTPVGAGEAIITATSRSDGTKTGQATVTVSKKELTVGGSFTVNDKEYNGTTSAVINENSLSVVGVVYGDENDVTLNVVAVFANANVADDITVSLTGASSLGGAAAGNYTLSLDSAPTAAADIIAKELTVINAVAQNKTYDGTTAATISGAGLSGVVTGDSVTLGDDSSGTFAQTTVGTGITVNTAMIIIGGDIGNYTLTQPTLTADITVKELTVINAVAQNKTYDGTVAATISGAELSGVVTGDSVTLGDDSSGTFAQTTVGTGITVNTAMIIIGADAGN